MSSEADSANKKMFGFSTKSLIMVVVFGVVVIATLGSAIFFYVQYQNTQEQLKKSTAVAAEQEAKSLVEEVGRLIMLPTSETPTIATVSDVGKLKEQKFFTSAKNGDKVLIYTKAQKAVLYDPVKKKVIEVGPINLAQATPTSAVSPTPGIVKVVLYNGTATTGLTTTIERQLKTALPTVLVTDKSNANNTSYTKTLVIDLSADNTGLKGKHTADASALAKTLNGTVGTLPAGEIKPNDADVLVILGK